MGKRVLTKQDKDKRSMSKLDQAMLTHIDYIVNIEHRPFSYRDFENFQVNGRWYHISHGSCRNKFSQLVKAGIIELEYNSKVAYYTLKGHHFGNNNMMTRKVMGISSVTSVTSVTNNTNYPGMIDLFNYIRTIPHDEAGVHDVHYKFIAPDIYKVVSLSDKYEKLTNSVSKDIILPSDLIDGLKIQTIIHRTDTVTASIACSSTPITINEVGVLRASLALTRAEERLSMKLDECGRSLPGGYEKIPIPDNRTWTVTMWHFGKDGRFEYCKKGYSLTWGYGREVLRIYARSLQSDRIDLQEYPNKPFAEAIFEKRQQQNCNIELSGTTGLDPTNPVGNLDSEKGQPGSNSEAEFH
jgi:hypothetical protein